MYFTQEQYEAFDKGVNDLAYKLDRTQCCKTYSEYVHKCYEDGMSCSEIGSQFSITKSAIKSHLKKMGIPRRPRGGRNYWKVTEEMRFEILNIPRTDRHYAEKFGLHRATVYKIRHEVNK